MNRTEEYLDMPSHITAGGTTLERLRRRYESTDTKCPECGHVDTEGNWSSEMDGLKVVYTHVCPSCGADRKHFFELDR